MTRLVALALCSVLATACGSTPPTGQVWRFAIEEIAGSVQDAYARRFAESVERQSEGRIRVEIYPYGTLGTSDQVTELVQMGAVELAMASPGHLGTLIPETQVLLLHFLFPDATDATRAVLAADGPVARRLAPAYRAKELELLAFVVEGWQAWTAQQPLRRPADFAGLKIRVMTSPLLVAAYEAYGATPVPLPYGDVYSALQLGMIDAQVNPIFAIAEMSFHEVTEAMTMARHAPFVTSVIAGGAFAARLDRTRRDMVDVAAAEAADAAVEAEQALNDRRLAEILERKPHYRVVELSEAERARFRAASRSVRRRFVELVGPSGAVVLRTVDRAVRAVAARDARHVIRAGADTPRPRRAPPSLPAAG